MRRLLLTLLFLSLADASCLAWDNGGHEIVDAIAYAHLNPKAKLAVDRLAAQLHGLRGAYDAITLGCWMDDIRSDPAVPPDDKLRTWHYIDIPLEPNAPKPPFEPGTDNLLHGNAVQALKRALVVLRGGTDPYIRDQPTALAIVMHLVGDIHQPLHCATNILTVRGNPVDDRGGNLELVRNGPPDNAKFTLHAFWDSAWRASFDATTGNVVLEGPYRPGVEPPDMRPLAAQLDPLGLPHDASDLAGDFNNWANRRNDAIDDFDGWARESNAIARNLVYPGITVSEDGKACRLGSAYVAQSRGVARQQLALAGHSLAELLNLILGGAAPLPVPLSYPPGPP